MRPVYLETSDASGGAVATAVCPMDQYLNPFSVSLQTVVTGTATYTVEWTQANVFEEGFDPDAAGVIWNAVDGMEDETADATATFDKPVAAFRMRQTAGDGSVQLIIRQGGAAS